MAMSDTRFQKGQSGNPSGRPKLPEELRARVRTLSGPAVDVLERCLNDPDPHVQLKAAAALLDRAWGRPAQDVNLTTKKDASQEHLAALVDIARVRAGQPVDLGQGARPATPGRASATR